MLTYLFEFSVLGVLAYLVYQDQPPLPGRVTSPSGAMLFTRQDILAGMHVFQRYGVMEYGSIYGHGAYLGPDFTADYLHRSAEGLTARYRAEPIEGASAEERVRSELHANTYEPATDRLLWTEARVDMHRQLRAYYQRLFNNGLPDGGMQARYIEDPEAMRQLTAFFAWTAWTATANRPGRDYSYTNN